MPGLQRYLLFANLPGRRSEKNINRDERKGVWDVLPAGTPAQPCWGSGDVPGGTIHTFNGQQDDPRVVVGDDVGVAVLGLVHLQVGVLPGELLPRVDGLEGLRKETGESVRRKAAKAALSTCFPWL